MTSATLLSSSRSWASRNAFSVVDKVPMCDDTFSSAVTTFCAAASHAKAERMGRSVWRRGEVSNETGGEASNETGGEASN